MLVTFYKTLDSKNVINKTLTNPTSFDLKLREINEVISPVLRMSNDVSAYNYCHIPYFNRYYFVERIERQGKLFLVGLYCDVLESYKADILTSNARFKRNIKNGDFENISIDYSNKTTSTKHISNGAPLQGETMIISVLGV